MKKKKIKGTSAKVHSRLVQVNVSRVVRDCITILNQKRENGMVPLVLIPSERWMTSVCVWIPSGVTCLLQRFGKHYASIGDDKYHGSEDPGKGKMSAGWHWLPCYYRIAYVVSQQVCTYDAPVFECPTSDNVRVAVDVVILFQVVDAYQFVYCLGVQHFDEYLSGTVDECIRQLVRQRDHTEVYTLRGENAAMVKDNLNSKFNDLGVVFMEVMVTSVWLPQTKMMLKDERDREVPGTLAECLERTTQMSKEMDKVIRKNEFVRMTIKQESEMAIEELKRRGEQAIVKEKGRKREGEMKREQQTVKAEENQQVALIEAETEAMKKRMLVNAELNRKKTNLETWKVEEISKAEADALATRIEADLYEESEQLKAEAAKATMVGDAEAQKQMATAEQIATRSEKAKRSHELDLREKDILCQLARTGHFNLVGEPGDRLVAGIMAGTIAKK